MNHDKRKRHGIHYTPPELAAFLARVTVRHVCRQRRIVEVLDPACGGGSLLRALVDAMPAEIHSRLCLFGFETDREAVRQAERTLSGCQVRSIHLEELDFLSLEGISSVSPDGQQRSLFAGEKSDYLGRFDAVMANPPYVRTQVLGSNRSRQLAREFDLTGRVDLYHAFVKAMAATLQPGGILGLLTSNRFLTVKSGAALRRLLRTEFELEEVYDLGDTKLFDAAVLPVVVVCRKKAPSANTRCTFDRVYEYRGDQKAPSADHSCNSVVDVLLDRRVKGIVRTSKGTYTVERGTLLAGNSDDVWSLTTPESQEWLRVVESHRACSFGDLSVVRVGIKTTADKVFVRDDWKSLPVDQQPEDLLLRPLITHSIAGRWLPSRPPGASRVLYPHMVKDGKRSTITLGDYPRALRYLVLHRQRLQRRKYVMDAGRQWYELWVPHNPDGWQKPKIVFPDIAELPRFFLDRTGAVVNGDCYWIALKEGIEEDWLLMMLAVANSSFVTKYYDVVFHNKLYAGRRRFMTQYVREFPLPAIDSHAGRQIVALALKLVGGPCGKNDESAVDGLIWEAFGLREEIRRQV